MNILQYLFQDPWAVIFIFLGWALLTTEIFIPGFGMAAVPGLVFVFLGIYFKSGSLLEVLIWILISIVFLGVMVYFSFRSAVKGRVSRSGLVLKMAETVEAGYTSAKNTGHLVGMVGVTKSVLRPSGVAEFDGLRIDVLTEGEFVKSGVKVRVTMAQGARIVVEPVQDSPDETIAQADEAQGGE